MLSSCDSILLDKNIWHVHTFTGNQSKTCITEEDIISQAFIFFFGGFESVARTMCFMAHELAIHADIQQKVREEIEKVNEKNDRKLTYDILNEMKYLDIVLSG